MEYRLIALDVDGTLLNDDHELTEPTRQAVREAHEAGARIVLCTGRGPYNAIPVMEELGLTGVVITHNGAATVESADRSIVHQYSFGIERVLPVIGYCRERGVHYDICSALDLFADRAGEEERIMYRNYGIEPIFVPDITRLAQPMVKLTLFGPPAVMDQAERDLPLLRCPLSIIRSGDRFIDVMHPEASKGAALRQLAAQMGLDRSQIMAIGNYYNDVEMIEFAGFGIAMANSPDDVKRRADAVTSSNNEDGVCLALRRYLLEQ